MRNAPAICSSCHCRCASFVAGHGMWYRLRDSPPDVPSTLFRVDEAPLACTPGVVSVVVAVDDMVRGLEKDTQRTSAKVQRVVGVVLIRCSPHSASMHKPSASPELLETVSDRFSDHSAQGLHVQGFPFFDLPK